MSHASLVGITAYGAELSRADLSHAIWINLSRVGGRYDPR